LKKTLLHFFEYPPDPNRGFDIGSAVIQATFPECPQILDKSPLIDIYFKGSCKENDTYRCYCEKNLYIFTSGLTVSLPTPDFSMPYNVITMSCTVIAFFFGQMVRTLTRRYTEIYRNGEFITNRPIYKFFGNILSFFVRENVKDND